MYAIIRIVSSYPIHRSKVDIIVEYNIVYFEYEADATSISIYFNAIYHIDISTLNSIAYTAIKRTVVRNDSNCRLLDK
jgi:phosphate starvation-inducible membrane PsiE